MKRAGQLIAAVADFDNLRLAFWKAAKGKRGKPDCMAFQNELERKLEEMRVEILAKGIRVGDYHYFKINDPKERMICAASFRERVLHRVHNRFLHIRLRVGGGHFEQPKYWLGTSRSFPSFC